MNSKLKYNDFVSQLPETVSLVAVSKTKSADEIMELYEAGHRDFGENYAQELVSKYETLPKDIRWHFIGHLQTNKVKFITGFVHLIHSVDSWKLLVEINKQGEKSGRIISCLIQSYVGNEETKYGLDPAGVEELLLSEDLKKMKFVSIRGLMAMASNTEDNDQVKREFILSKNLFDAFSKKDSENMRWEILSMGMSGDYGIAIESGSNMIRVGSLLFGERTYIK